MFAVLLDDIRSAYNVGSVFRTADSAGVDKLILTGRSVYPDSPKLNKTALDSQHHVSWEHHCLASQAVTYYKQQSIHIICFEITSRSIPLFTYSFPNSSLLVFGNEVDGIHQDVINLADDVVMIPQYGIKESLNIASAAAIGIYEYRRQHSEEIAPLKK
jgi:tRNA G18 (ribose-2'-O)-methylase SpoU